MIAEGDNFSGVLTTPGICNKTTSTNNIAQIQKVLGIEAARYIIAAPLCQSMFIILIYFFVLILDPVSFVKFNTLWSLMA